MAQEGCVNCLMEKNLADFPEPTPMNKSAQIGWTNRRGGTCDGINIGSNRLSAELQNPANAHNCAGKGPMYCHKNAGPKGWGSRIVNDFYCWEAARNDPECSNIVIRTTDYAKRCMCWRKDPCCGQCAEVPSRYGLLYELP